MPPVAGKHATTAEAENKSGPHLSKARKMRSPKAGRRTWEGKQASGNLGFGESRRGTIKTGSLRGTKRGVLGEDWEESVGDLCPQAGEEQD